MCHQRKHLHNLILEFQWNVNWLGSFAMNIKNFDLKSDQHSNLYSTTRIHTKSTTLTHYFLCGNKIQNC